MEIVLALCAAALFALGSVLQQRAGAEAPVSDTSGPLLVRMARRPVWLAGIAADGLGFICQAVALGIGRLSVVQPLLVTSIAFALPFGAWLGGQRVHRREALAALVVVAGLGAFVVSADPAGGRPDAPLDTWLLAAAICGGLCLPMILAAPRGRGPRRAALLGVATGILFALSAALTKTTVNELSNGIPALLSSWQLYGLLAIGYASMTLNQLSLDAGALSATMSSTTTLDPIVSVGLGLILFRETMHDGSSEIVVIVLALIAALGAMIVLAHEQAVSVASQGVRT